MTRLCKNLLVAASTVLCSVQIASATNLVIDDYSVIDSSHGSATSWNISLSTTGGPVTGTKLETGLDTAHVIGGSRFVSATVARAGTSPFGSGGATLSTTSGISPGEGTFSVVTGAGAFGDFYTEYDANGAGLGLDLSSYESIVFDEFHDLLATDRPTIYSMLITDSNGASAVVNGFVQNTFLGGQGSITSEFILSAGLGLNLSNISKIRFNFQLGRGQDSDFYRVTAVDKDVPEPASLAFFGVAGLLAATRSRRS